MATNRKFKTDAIEANHSLASAMYKVGAIDKTTMREFRRILALTLLAVVQNRGLEAVV